jgi:hypothetical protein
MSKSYTNETVQDISPLKSEGSIHHLSKTEKQILINNFRIANDLRVISFWTDYILEEMYSYEEATEDDFKNAETFGTYDDEIGQYVLQE